MNIEKLKHLRNILDAAIDGKIIEAYSNGKWKALTENEGFNSTWTMRVKSATRWFTIDEAVKFVKSNPLISATEGWQAWTQDYHLEVHKDHCFIVAVDPTTGGAVVIHENNYTQFLVGNTSGGFGPLGISNSEVDPV